MTKVKSTISIILIALLPSPMKKFYATHVLGWRLEPGTSIGLSIVSAKRVHLGKQSRIGHFNVIRDLEAFVIGDHSSIAQWNWISSSPLLVSDLQDATGTFCMGTHSDISSRHYIDCSGGVTIGDFTTIAGVRSTIISHQIDIAEAQQTTSPVRIGNYNFIGSDVRITPGISIADRSVLAMGSVVAKHLDESNKLYAGVPARAVKDLRDANYFDREFGWVGANGPEPRPSQ